MGRLRDLLDSVLGVTPEDPTPVVTPAPEPVVEVEEVVEEETTEEESTEEE